MNEEQAQAVADALGSETWQSGGGKWRYWSSFSTSLRGTVAFGISTQEVREEIKKHGYARRRLERMLRAAS